MTVRIRAKFRCESATRHAWSDTATTYKFAAVYDPDLPEDQRFAKATPSGSLEMLVDNPSAEFLPGCYYYLEFVQADEKAPDAA